MDYRRAKWERQTGELLILTALEKLSTRFIRPPLETECASPSPPFPALDELGLGTRPLFVTSAGLLCPWRLGLGLWRWRCRQ